MSVSLPQGLKLASNRTLTSLDLTAARIGPKGAGALCRALGAISAVRTLSLKGNALGPVGAEELARALVSNGSLATLNAADNGFGPGARDLMCLCTVLSLLRAACAAA